MRRYVAGRLLLMIPTLIGVAILTFVIMRAVPGDIVALQYAGSAVPQSVIDEQRHLLGLDKPMWNQFTDWMGQIAHGDLGQSLWTGHSVVDEIAIRYRYSAVSMRMTRSTVLEVLREDYVRTARAKGVRESVVVMRHALRNALLPVVTVISLEFAFLIGGLVVTEQVFNLNGIGKLLVDAVAHRDYTLIQALVLLLASVFVLINFVVDMVYVVLDPRIRYS